MEPHRLPITVDVPGEIIRVDHLIHDRWFSVNDVEFQAGSGEFSIVYSHDETIDRRVLDSVKGQPNLWRLIIRHVISYHFKDREKIVWYDFNRIRFERRTGHLQILTNTPLLLRFKVTTLDLIVEPAAWP